MTLKGKISEKVRQLTEEPGVYQMKDAQGHIIYIGKAKNLKNRVGQYFQEGADHPPRTQLLVSKVHDFDIVITDNEAEALVLECELIKKYQPKYNVRLKDDKSYPFVRIDMSHHFPRLEYVRNIRKARQMDPTSHRASHDASNSDMTKRQGKGDVRYFGPYVSAFQIKDLLTWARKTFLLRDCSDHEFANRSRPCLLFQMKQCSAPCVGYITEERYHQDIKHVLMLLDHHNSEISKVVDALEKQMWTAAEAEDFEDAQKYRDQIQKIKEFIAELEANEQKMVDPESKLDRDVVQIEQEGEHVVVLLLASRKGAVVAVTPYFLQNIEEKTKSELLNDFLAQYYVGQMRSEEKLVGPELPKEVLIPFSLEPEQQKVLQRALLNRIDFRVPQRGEAAQLLALVQKTAAYHLQEKLNANQQRYGDLFDLKQRLDLPQWPKRIECFDISHFQGDSTVASRVVFVEGQADKNLYRRYHIKSVDGVDDFASMREVLSRRFSHDDQGADEYPDLLVIDGGKGQLAQAVLVLHELNISHVPVVGLAKARTQKGFQQAQVDATQERVFKPGQMNPVLLRPGTGAFRIMTQVRDESHRFAIQFHRKTRDKKRVRT